MRPGDLRRYRGGASRRRHGQAALGIDPVRAGLALDAQRRDEPLVSGGAAVPADCTRRLARRGRARRRRAGPFRRVSWLTLPSRQAPAVALATIRNECPTV